MVVLPDATDHLANMTDVTTAARALLRIVTDRPEPIDIGGTPARESSLRKNVKQRGVMRYGRTAPANGRADSLGTIRTGSKESREHRVACAHRISYGVGASSRPNLTLSVDQECTVGAETHEYRSNTMLSTQVASGFTHFTQSAQRSTCQLCELVDIWLDEIRTLGNRSHERLTRRVNCDVHSEVLPLLHESRVKVGISARGQASCGQQGVCAGKIENTCDQSITLRLPECSTDGINLCVGPASYQQRHVRTHRAGRGKRVRHVKHIQLSLHELSSFARRGHYGVRCDSGPSQRNRYVDTLTARLSPLSFCAMDKSKVKSINFQGPVNGRGRGHRDQHIPIVSASDTVGRRLSTSFPSAEFLVPAVFPVIEGVTR